MDSPATNPTPAIPQTPVQSLNPTPQNQAQNTEVLPTETTPTFQQPVPSQLPPTSLPPTNNTADTSSSNKKTILLIVGIIGGLLVLGICAYIVIKLIPSKKTNSPGGSVSVLSKYSEDKDGDGISDVIETEIGLNPAVSEITRCKPASCDASDKAATENTKGNILFIIDSSGSMGLKIGNTTKMDLAKEAIRNFLKNIENNVDVGIMVYGNKGSNSDSDKVVSCSSADTIAAIGSVSASTIDSYLSQIQPVGWTPIGLAIRNAQTAFSGKESQKNQIIVVTDGAETCNTNPAGAASEAKNSPYQIQVNVIGFAINASEQSSLQAISTNGGGLFSVANNADELYNQMQANLKNFQNFQKDATCVNDAYQKSTTCLGDVVQQLNTYFASATTDLGGSEWTELTNIQTNTLSVLNKQIYAWQDEQTNLLQNSRQLVK